MKNYEREVDKLEKKVARLGKRIDRLARRKALKPSQKERLTSLNEQYFEKQREHNKIVDEHQLSAVKTKYSIDSFSFYKDRYSVLDPVEIDLSTRLSNASYSTKAYLLAESEDYRFYQCERMLLREKKSTNEVVFFRKYVYMACTYKGKLYWSGQTTFISDSFLFRCNLEDGEQVEQLDWLNYEQIAKVRIDHVHYDHLDSIERMSVVNDTLQIIVKRTSKDNARYLINVKETNGQTRVTKQRISGDFSSYSDYASFER